MADLERGQRIKARRVEMHLTQPALVDLMEEMAKQLPEAHALNPEKSGKAPVTLRGLQTWEQGGGVTWEKAKLLASALQTESRWLINGIEDDAPSPSPFAGPDATQDRLDSIDERLTRLEALLERVLEHRSEQGADIIGRLAGLEDALTGRVEAVDERLRELGLAVAHPEAPSAPPREPAQRAVSRSKRAAAPRTPSRP